MPVSYGTQTEEQIARHGFFNVFKSLYFKINEFYGLFLWKSMFWDWLAHTKGCLHESRFSNQRGNFWNGRRLIHMDIASFLKCSRHSLFRCDRRRLERCLSRRKKGLFSLFYAYVLLLLAAYWVVGQTRQIRKVNDSLFPCRKNRKFSIWWFEPSWKTVRALARPRLNK